MWIVKQIAHIAQLNNGQKYSKFLRKFELIVLTNFHILHDATRILIDLQVYREIDGIGQDFMQSRIHIIWMLYLHNVVKMRHNEIKTWRFHVRFASAIIDMHTQYKYVHWKFK